jgi:hypothetical protein
MRIENHQLITDTAAIDLPHLPTQARVRVWRVPHDYRQDGLFVSIQLPSDPEELPACDLARCELALDAEMPAHPDAQLAEHKAAKKRQIEADRDAAATANVTVNDHVWQADKRSQDLLGQAIALAQAGLPLPPVWRDADNNDMPVTSIADLLAIAGAIAAQVQTAYQTAWARKAAVDAAKTLDEIEAA